MELKEMIKVMQHFDNGGKVEYREKWSTKDWRKSNDPYWIWDRYDYRIKEPKQKVTIEKWLCRNSKQEEFVIYETSNVDKNRQLEKIKFIESYEVEL